MSDGTRIITIPRHHPVNAFTMGGIAHDAGLTPDLRLADGRELRDVCVFNAEEAELPEAVADVGIADMRLHSR